MWSVRRFSVEHNASREKFRWLCSSPSISSGVKWSETIFSKARPWPKNEPVPTSADPLSVSYDVYGFWNLDEAHDEDITVPVMVDRVMSVLSKFGRVRDLNAFGSHVSELPNFRSFIDQRRKSLRDLVGLKDCSSETSSTQQKRRHQNVDDAIQHPLPQVDAERFFKDRTWSTVPWRQKSMTCELCHRGGFHDAQTLTDHFLHVHAKQLDAVVSQISNAASPEQTMWWNNGEKAREFLAAVSSIGIWKGSISDFNLKCILTTLGVAYEKVRPAKGIVLNDRQLANIRVTLKRWSAKVSPRFPIVALIAKENPPLIRACEQLQEQYPGLRLLCILPDARKHNFRRADWNFDWREVTSGVIQPI